MLKIFNMYDWSFNRGKERMELKQQLKKNG